MGIQTEEEMIYLEEKYHERINENKERWRRLRLDGRLYKYMISNHGRLRNTHGEIMYTYNYKGYEYVNIFYDVGVRKKMQVHRLVAMNFIPIPDKYIDLGYSYKDLQINHIDGCPLHNDIWNLEWVTPKENTHHAHKTGLAWIRYGQFNNNAILDNENVHYICELLEKGSTIIEIGNKFPDIKQATLMSIATRENWKDVSKNYNIDNFPHFNMSGENFRKKIFHEFNIGTPLVDIAKKYKLTSHHIKYIKFCYNHQYISNPFKWMDKTYKKRNPKLTIDDVHMICRYLENGLSNNDIKNMIPYVSDRVIYSIKNRHTWQEISNSYKFGNRSKILTDDDIHNICKDIISCKYTTKEIASKYNTSTRYINDLRNKKRRKDITCKYNFY